MKRLEQLPEIARTALAGLNADERLHRRILVASASPRTSRPAVRRTVLAVACAAMAALLLYAVTPRLGDGADIITPDITSMTLGQGPTANERSSLDTTVSEVTVQTGGSGDSGIWAVSGGGSFPVVCVNGRYYRQLTTGTVAAASLGNSLGTVGVYTSQPELASGSQIVSNCLGQGTEVCEVSGMGGTLIASWNPAGEVTLYQRVSFNGQATRAGEGLADTLQVSGHITSMTLSGTGSVTGQTAEDLFSRLTQFAVFESSGSVSAKQTLLIALDNGATVQLAVRNDRLGACGVWSCPEFFEAFRDAAR